MYRKIANTFCKVLIYMIAFVVAALMGIMLIHILKESIPALREVGIKMFLPSSEWRPVSAAPQYGLLPAVTGTLYVSGLAVLFAMILGVACACFLTFFHSVTPLADLLQITQNHGQNHSDHQKNADHCCNGFLCFFIVKIHHSFHLLIFPYREIMLSIIRDASLLVSFSGTASVSIL